MATKHEINEIMNELHEERFEIIGDIISANAKCADVGIDAIDGIMTYDCTKSAGHRSAWVSYEQLNADRLDVLCSEIEEQVELLQNYLSLMQTLAYNQRKAEEWAKVEPDEE